MGRYAIVDANGNVVNVVMWDGQSEFPPAVEHKAIEVAPDVPAEPDGKWHEGGKPEWVPAPRSGR